MSNVLAINKTLSSITVSAWAVYYINSSNAELVTVYDSSNNPYDCFKYLLNNISYYYVLDGVQNAWTNDLSVIGYSLTPSVVLPTVTYVGQLIYPNGGLTSDETGTLRDSNNNPIDYNTGSSYAVYWYASSSLSYGDVSYVSLVNESGLLKVKNISNAYLSIYFVSTYECSSNAATVVPVYNSSNVAYNAFKFTVNNTDYYYVLDGTQADWTDDLSSIGYSLTPTLVLPTVVKDGYTLYGTSDIRSITIASGETHDLYEFEEGKKSFDTSKSYATDRWQQDSAYTRNNVNNLQIVNNSGYFAVKNTSSDAITNFVCIVIATCSSNQAAVITVYNSSNVAYNAFKFTASGTDYYYVLDGTQTDWTDDLSSIGYRLDMQFYFYFSMNNDNPVDVTFDYPSGSNYWGLRIQNQSDKDILDSLGLFAATQYPASAPYGYLKAHTAQTSFSYELKAIFLPDDTQAPFSLSDFYCYAYNSIECVVCSGSYSTPVRSCMISIKPIS